MVLVDPPRVSRGYLSSHRRSCYSNFRALALPDLSIKRENFWPLTGLPLPCDRIGHDYGTEATDKERTYIRCLKKAAENGNAVHTEKAASKVLHYSVFFFTLLPSSRAFELLFFRFHMPGVENRVQSHLTWDSAPSQRR